MYKTNMVLHNLSDIAAVQVVGTYLRLDVRALGNVLK